MDMMAEWNGYPLLDDATPLDVFFDPAYARGAVPRDYTVQPVEMLASPDEMTLIPRSEWDARIDEQDALQSSLEHLYLGGDGGQPRFVNLDQNGQGYCHTADTEVLTEKGFVPFPEYNWTDLLGTVNPATHALEFQPPFQKHVYDYDGPMVYSTNKRLDFGVTPDHQMYVRKWDEGKRTLSDKYSFVRAGDLGWYAGVLAAPSGQIGTEIVELEVPGDRRYSGDDFFALLGLIVSDGYAGGTENTRNWVSFASFRETTREVIGALARRNGFHEVPSRPGVWIRYDAAALANWIRENCYSKTELKSQNKRCPDLVKVASMRQIRIFLEYFDDRSRDGRQFYSSSKRLIDDLQELHLRVGKRSTINPVAAKDTPFPGNKAGVIKGGPGFVLTVGQTDRLCIDKKKHIETDRYKGQVYCAAVPNHTLITRRNGTTLISSNCWAYSTGHVTMLARLRDNEPLVRLNPHSVASIIKGGRDEGGWCGLSAQFLGDMGIAPEGNGPGQWPKQSLDLRNDTPTVRAEMARYKSGETWIDLAPNVWYRNLTFDQLASCPFCDQPCAVDFNWWGHSVCAVRVVRVEAGSYGLLILNSWLNWGRSGLAVLRGDKAIPNGAVCIRTTRAS